MLKELVPAIHKTVDLVQDVAYAHVRGKRSQKPKSYVTKLPQVGEIQNRLPIEKVNTATEIAPLENLPSLIQRRFSQRRTSLYPPVG